MLFEVITRGCIDNNKEFDNKGHILFHFKGLKRWTSLLFARTANYLVFCIKIYLLVSCFFFCYVLQTTTLNSLPSLGFFALAMYYNLELVRFFRKHHDLIALWFEKLILKKLSYFWCISDFTNIVLTY